jgi:hypothetical protein
MDFKVKVKSTEADCFTIGNTYSIINGRLKDDEGDEWQNNGKLYNNLLELNEQFSEKDEFTTQFELVPDRPHICEVLGVEVGEPFDVIGLDGTVYFRDLHVNGDGNIVTISGPKMAAQTYLEGLINGSMKIIRTPQFSEDEKALFKVFHTLGYDFWAMTTGGYLYVCKDEPKLSNGGYLESHSNHYQLDANFLPSLKINSKINAAEYLEAQK